MTSTTPHELLARLSIDSLRKAVKFAATNDVRYYLQGVAILGSHKDGVFLAASNGHFAGLILDEFGMADISQPLIISADVVRALPRARPGITVELWGVPGQTTGHKVVVCGPGIKGPSVTFNDATVDGRFPEIRRILPHFGNLKPGISTAAFFWPYLRDAVAVLAGLSGSDGGVEFYQEPEKHSGSLIITNSQRNAFAVVMPRRSSAELVRPGWVFDSEFKGGAA